MQDQSAVIAPSARMTKTALIVIAFAGLGGFLYGFDIGVISGALGFMENEFSLSTTQIGFIVAAVLLGGAPATLVSGPFSDRFGRRLSITLSAVIFIVGTIILLVATDFAVVMAGRVIEGFGIGIITIVVPLYMAETIPANLRGRGIALFQLALTFGILIGYVDNYALKATADWRYMFAIALIPAILFLLGCLFLLPRSPRWLYVHGHVDEARDVLARTQADRSVDASLADMRAVIEEERERGTGSWRLLLATGYRKAFLLALGVGIFTQLTGINVLLQYATKILGDTGLHTAMLGSISIGVINFVVTAIALSLVDKAGRKPLLILGTAGIMVSLAFVGVVQGFFPATQASGYATLAGLMAFVVFYAVGPGVVVWLAISEVMPMAIRAKGMSVALFANSVTSGVLGVIFGALIASIGLSGMFFMMAAFTLIYLLIAIFPLPETKGRSLEDIEKALFAGVKPK